MGWAARRAACSTPGAGSSRGMARGQGGLAASARPAAGLAARQLVGHAARMQLKRQGASWGRVAAARHEWRRQAARGGGEAPACAEAGATARWPMEQQRQQQQSKQPAVTATQLPACRGAPLPPLLPVRHTYALVLTCAAARCTTSSTSMAQRAAAAASCRRQHSKHASNVC